MGDSRSDSKRYATENSQKTARPLAVFCCRPELQNRPELPVNTRTDDLRIRDIRELITPEELSAEFPCTARVSATVAGARSAMHGILHGKDDRLAVVIGPCSIHDIAAAREYASRLIEQRQAHL